MSKGNTDEPALKGRLHPQPQVVIRYPQRIAAWEIASAAQRAHVRTAHRPGWWITRRKSAVERVVEQALAFGCRFIAIRRMPARLRRRPRLAVATEMFSGGRVGHLGTPSWPSGPHVFALPVSHANFQHTPLFHTRAEKKLAASPRVQQRTAPRSPKCGHFPDPP